MAAVTVRSIYDLMVVAAPLVGVDYPLPDFSLNVLVRGSSTFFA